MLSADIEKEFQDSERRMRQRPHLVINFKDRVGMMLVTANGKAHLTAKDTPTVYKKAAVLEMVESRIRRIRENASSTTSY